MATTSFFPSPLHHHLPPFFCNPKTRAKPYATATSTLPPPPPPPPPPPRISRNYSSDKFTFKRFHHIEFWCTDAVSTATRFSHALGIPLVATSGLSTGNLIHSSLLLRSGDLLLLFSAPYSPSSSSSSSSTAAVPTFSHSSCRRFAAAHGVAVRSVAVEVEDAVSAFFTSVDNGAEPSAAPIVVAEGVVISEVRLYGDVVLRYISYRNPRNQNVSDPAYWFMPGFERVSGEFGAGDLDFGIRRLDHAVGNVPEIGPVVSYIKRFTGFHEFMEFSADDVGTSESGLNSVVLASNEERVLLPLNEPVSGTKRKSQIQTFLEHNEGPGVQHLALATDDIFKTLREMKRRSGFGGFGFMPSPSPSYYSKLKSRVGDVLTDDQIAECEELGILVDRDDQGTLLQVFTKPVGDRWGYGWILREAEGIFRVTGSGKLGGCMSAAVVEAWGCRDAIRWMFAHGIKGVEVESDFKKFVDVVNGVEEGQDVFHMLIEDYKELISKHGQSNLTRNSHGIKNYIVTFLNPSFHY